MIRLTVVGFFVISLMFVGQSDAKIDPENCVGMWLFDKNNGDVAQDSSGNGNDGQLFGNPKPVEGKFGGALEFSGADMVIVPDNDALDLGEFTVAVWVKAPNPPGAWGTIVTKDIFPPATRNYGLFCQPNTGLVHYAFGSDADGAWGRSEGVTVVTDGDWHHVAATYKNPDFKLYVDGVLDGEIAPGLEPNENDGFLYIGGYDLQNFWMVGTIDEVVLFNRVLSEEDIGELMEGASSVLAVQPAAKFSVTWGNIKQ